MRNFLIHWLVIAQVLSSPTLAAAEENSLDAVLDTLTKLRDSLHVNFYDNLHAQVKNGVMTHYLYTVWDHSATREILAIKANTGRSQLARLKQDFGEHKARLFLQGEDWEQSATAALALIGRAQGLAIESKLIQQDASTLKESWLSQCRSELKNRLVNYYTPLAFAQLIELGEATPVQPHLEIGAQVQFDFSGQPTGGSGEGVGMSEVDSAVVSVGMALLYSANPIGVIAGIVVLAAWAIYKIGSYLIARSQAVKKEKKILEIREEIRDFQLAVINRVHDETPTLIQEACAQSFPTASADQLTLKLFNDYASEAQVLYEGLKAEGQNLIQAFQEKYTHLAQFYFPQVQSSYLALVKERAAKTQKMQNEVNAILDRVFLPLFSEYEKVKDSASPSQWIAQHQIWTAVIQTDGLYRTKSGYSFFDPLASGGETPAFSNSWNTIGPKLGRIFQ